MRVGSSGAMSLARPSAQMPSNPLAWAVLETAALPQYNADIPALST
jgi:hypothetical protein